MLLKVYTAQGKHQQANQLYAQLKVTHLPRIFHPLLSLPLLKPSLQESGNVTRKGLSGFIRNSKTQLAEAEKVYADMKASGQADRVAANAMLKAYAVAGEMDKGTLAC